MGEVLKLKLCQGALQCRRVLLAQRTVNVRQSWIRAMATKIGLVLLIQSTGKQQTGNCSCTDTTGVVHTPFSFATPPTNLADLQNHGFSLGFDWGEL
jgi:hypothetical protein